MNGSVGRAYARIKATSNSKGVDGDSAKGMKLNTKVRNEVIPREGEREE